MFYKYDHSLKISIALGIGFRLKRVKFCFSITLSSSFCLFFRFAWCNSICIGYSRHRIPAQTNDVYHSAACCVFHSLGVWRGHNTDAHVASDQVSTLFTVSTIKIEFNHYGSIPEFLQLSKAYLCVFNRVVQPQRKY